MPKYRMIHVDHYMCQPVSPFDDIKSELTSQLTKKVPVIRIFGADLEGRKICLHVHGFYPYVAIRNLDPQDPDYAKKIVDDIERALEEIVETNQRSKNEQKESNVIFDALTDRLEPLDSIEKNTDDNLASRLLKERPRLNYLSADQRAPVHRIEHVKSYNYYGYHNEPEDFLKLYLYNPKMVKQLASIFEDCKVLGRFIPVFWAHIPYILLFFIDNNLRGMQFIEVRELYWRKNKAPISEVEIPSSPTNGPNNANFREERDLKLLITEVEPVSTCELEADIRFEWIVNRFGSRGNDDALKELWLDDQEEPVKPKIEPEILKPRLGRELVCQDDEFSDDDFMVEAVIRAESQISTLRIQNSVSPCKTESNSKDNRKPYSDNSLIDGKSVICSTANQTRSGSQRSTSSSREIVSHEYQYLCIMSMEVHTSSRGKLKPDPALDPIEAIFYCIRSDAPQSSSKPSQIIGIILTDPSKQYEANQNVKSPVAVRSLSRSNLSLLHRIRTLMHKTGLPLKDVELNVVDTELELIMALVGVVKTNDPEIMIGYETEQLSWGYILERSSILNLNISAALSRIIGNKLGHNSRYVESTFVQPIVFTGRMVFSTWRIIRHEVNLNTCSYERIHHHALDERVPCFGYETLTKWFNQNQNRWRVIDYYLTRVIGQMRILEKFDLIAKVSELARVYGTQFIDVITRGSQIGIESMMLRLAKLQNLTPLSPTVMQRNKMRAPEALPLVMEPETNIYYNPVAVLDFQSLYPSVVIAYNYCYSTCLGRVSDLESGERHQFGCSQLFVEPNEVKRLFDTDSVHISPCGVAFVKENVKHGILPKMLSELIVTRAMVKDQMKKNMKSDKPNRRLQRILDHRQFGLKMMANTTYGYTGASYTGRMPCVEIADSIVSKGRETLENAITIVESRAEWNAKVIYGDTDSIFIEFEGCSKDIAFKRAYEMIEAITAANPYPIKMKFEKIYQPCVLQTKKRYCGFKYEQPDQTRPEFEAKGIETIRRDCCPAAARILEMALRIQFTTRDIEEVKRYVQHQFIKITSGKLSNIQDYIFARQYKPRNLDKSESVFVPAWQITKRLLMSDPRAEPRLGERVPFVIVYGESRTPLVNLAKTPIELLETLSYRINYDYYIQKIICPTLNRIFCTMNVDTLAWYKSMPHKNIIHRSHYLIAQRNQRNSISTGTSKQSTISQYFGPSHCPVCAQSISVSDDICGACRENLQSSVVRLSEEVMKNQRKLAAYHQLCRACSSTERGNATMEEHYNPCISYDCQNLFRYHQAKLDTLNSDYLCQILRNLN